jgi:hypothetical protein
VCRNPNHHRFIIFFWAIHACMQGRYRYRFRFRNIARTNSRAAPHRGRMKLTNKQGAFVQFLLNGRTLRIPKVTICPTSAITAAGATIYPFLFLSSSFPAAAVAAASQQSRYVLYIMRRRNKLVLLRVSSVTGGSNRQHGHHHSTTSHNHALISHERGRICGGVRTGRCMHLTTRPSLQMEDWFE